MASGQGFITVLHFCLLSGLVSSACGSKAAGAGLHWHKESKFAHDLIVFLFGTSESEFRHYIKPPGQLHVNITLSLNRIINMDEKTQILTAVFWMFLSWTDLNLYWDATSEKFGKVTSIRVPTHLIWEPDITLWNNVDDGYRHMLEEPTVTLENTGVVTWVEPRVFRCVCSLDIYHYPFDEHVCKFIFGSWTWDKTHLRMHVNERSADRSHFIPNNVWNIYAYSVVLDEHSHLGPEGNLATFATTTFEIDFNRRWKFPFIYLVVPTMIINCICVISFALPPDSNEKVGLATVTFLSLLVYLLLLQELLPIVEIIPLLVKYIMITVLSVTFNLIMSVLVLHVHCCASCANLARSPKWARRLFLKKIAPWIGLGKHYLYNEDVFKEIDKKIEITELAENVDISTVINQALSKAKESQRKHDRQPSWVSTDRPDSTNPILRKKEEVKSDEDNQDILLYKILRHCEYLKEAIVTEKILDLVKLEWIEIAKILDRMLFIVNFLFTLCVWYVLLFEILFTASH